MKEKFLKQIVPTMMISQTMRPLIVGCEESLRGRSPDPDNSQFLSRSAILVAALLMSGCQAPNYNEILTPSSTTNAATTSSQSSSVVPEDDKPYSKLDYLRKRFPQIDRVEKTETANLAAEFADVRATPGWKAFVQALKVCDDSVNTLLDEDILDWSNPGPKIDTINRARNAWRHAVTFGIRPPKLSVGWTSFVESDLSFRVNVVNKSEGVLIVRSQRGQVLGIFDLRLDDDGKQHIVAHMLERALRFPDLYLSYPWDILMATDTIYVPDVRVYVDRLKKTAKIVDTGSGETETKK